MEKSDEVLVNETRKGNKKSFELLVIKYERQIFNLIYRFTKNREDVGELAQDTFLKAFRSIHSFKGKSSFYTWLRRIAINNSINYLHAREHISLDSELEGTQMYNLTDHKTKNPEGSLLTKEVTIVVREAMDSLPEGFRSILIMREFEDMSYEEIAEVLECPVGTVRSRLFHARRLLKDKLKSFV